MKASTDMLPGFMVFTATFVCLLYVAKNNNNKKNRIMRLINSFPTQLINEFQMIQIFLTHPDFSKLAGTKPLFQF